MAHKLNSELQNPNSLKSVVVKKTRGWKKKNWIDLQNHVSVLPFEMFDRLSLESWNHGLSLSFYISTSLVSQLFLCCFYDKSNLLYFSFRKLRSQTCGTIPRTYSESRLSHPSKPSKCLSYPGNDFSLCRR